MLYPEQNSVRTCTALSGLWAFCLGGEALEPEKAAAPLENAALLAVPASYNDQKENPAFRTHCGWAYYQRSLTIPACYAGMRRVLRFDAVTHAARVYLNGVLLCEHKGGFLPFEAEITDCLAPGQTALLTVAVDNRVDHSTLPIGNPEGTAFFGSDNYGIPSVEAAKRRRKKQNVPNFDFFNYAGIQRPVRLYTTPKTYLADVTLVPELDGSTGMIHFAAALGGESAENAVPNFELLDAEGNTVAQSTGLTGTLRVENVRLWQPWPDTPYLYTVRVTCGEDEYSMPYGVRTVEVKGTQLLLNGKPFYFKGASRHEDFAVHGRGMDECVNVKDAGLLHWLNANSIRTSHYPDAEEWYRLCDREGIVVIDETPAVGIGAGAEQNPYETFSMRAHHEQVLHELIARDKNHACVVMWSLGNEPDTEHFPQSAYDYWHSLYELAHRLDPQNRPVTMVCCQNDYTKDIVTRTMDVVCINRYYGWYNLSGDLDAACYALDLELDFWAQQNKPVMITEYGADTVAGVHSTIPEMFSEEFQAEFYARLNACFDRRPFFIGEQAWVFADFNTLQGPMRCDGNRKGLFSRERRPKLVAHYFSRRWKEIPNFGYKEQDK